MHRFVGCIWVVDEPATREALPPATEAEQSGAFIPVFLQTRVTEIGTVDLYCVARNDDRQWKLEFNIREEEEA